MIKPISRDFSLVKEYDQSTASNLADYFDLDFVAQDPDQYRLYFQNLKTLASQNLGLAHCVIHNQSARSFRHHQ